MKRITIFTLTLLIVVALVAIPAYRAAVAPRQVVAENCCDDTECQACLDGAYSQRQQCYAMFGEGDADCSAQYDYAVSECQRFLCINEQAAASPATAEQIVARLSNVVAPNALACSTNLYPCDTCEQESWAQYEEAIHNGGNSCDGARAYVDYCWNHCRLCKHCSIMIAFYSDTNCPETTTR